MWTLKKNQSLSMVFSAETSNGSHDTAYFTQSNLNKYPSHPSPDSTSGRCHGRDYNLNYQTLGIQETAVGDFMGSAGYKCSLLRPGSMSS